MRKGISFLDDDYIEKKYEINSHLTSLPQEEQKVYRAKLNQIINTAYLQRVLSNRRKIVVGQYLI